MIEIYVNDIRRSLNNQCCFSALALSLTLPDICGFAEFPDKLVAERYISWYDKYVGEYVKDDNDDNDEICRPWLSGEMIYNLRNTYLHQGSLNIDADKVKEDANKVDKFILLWGNGENIQDMTLTVSYRSVDYRLIMVDVTYLCELLCECALEYYKKNSERFKNNSSIIPQEYLFGIKRPYDDTQSDSDPIVEILNKKLLEKGETVQIQESQFKRIREKFVRKLKKEDLSKSQKETNTKSKNQGTVDKTKAKTKNVSKKKAMSKEEQQLRAFFGRTFKEDRFKRNKDQIITTVLKAKTKTELNSELNKFFPGADVKIILKRLKPITKDWPGKLK